MIVINPLTTITKNTSGQDITRNIGEIIASLIPIEESGLHLLDGSIITNINNKEFVDYIISLKETYANLFITEEEWQTSVTTYGVCGKFVIDEINQTVKLPKIEGFIEGIIDETQSGELTEAGLPNITGGFSGGRSGGQTGYVAPSGAFARVDGTGKDAYDSGTNDMYIYSFDASRSNPIYGKSETIQPQSTKVLYYIVTTKGMNQEFLDAITIEWEV